MGDKKTAIKLFESKEIRTAWDSEKEEWYFSIQDVVEALTDSADVKQYIKKMKFELGYNLYPGYNDGC